MQDMRLKKIEGFMLIAAMLFGIFFPFLAQGQTAEELNERLKVLLAKKKYKEAFLIAEQELELSEKELGVDHEFIASILYTLAKISKELDDYDKALFFLKRGLLIAEKYHNPDGVNEIIFLNALGRIFGRQGNKLKLEESYKKAIIIAKKNSPEMNRHLLNSIIELGEFYYNENNLDESQRIFAQALEISDDSRVLFKKKLEVVYDYFGRIYIKQKKYPEAEKYLLKSLSLNEDVYGVEDPNLIPTLNDLGRVYYLSSQDLKAEEFFKRALVIAEDRLNNDDEGLIKILSNLGVLYLASERFDEASWVYDKLLGVYEREKNRHVINSESVTAIKKYILELESHGRKEEARKISQKISG